MKKLCLACLCLLASLAVQAQQTIAPATPNETTEVFFKAMLNEDASSLRSVLTTDFSLLSFDGQMIDGTTLADAVDGGYVVIETGVVSGLNTRTYGEAAVVNGFWQTKGAVQGNNFQTQVGFMSVCVRQGGAWKVAAMQFTPMP
ncbi:nuclear transport factor 2 family protein [Arundinibacter roseus]|uniref:Nuclear transport factor 2 family protein n=1 Tax=Arundinibacter roseus TaxID=2070510 RepID=A0A4R4K440_9BACT|nr:nuclear transport factor 2 family protein [Arundinibacter roseus]TDB60859.1 nuclear transport factor 2 family protein [Arundinibacter roseus]